MQGKITVLRANGSTEIYERDTMPTLEWRQEQVGGLIEHVPCFDFFEGERCHVWCNEEGKLKGLPVNDRATDAWLLSQEIVGVEIDDVLVGDVCIVQGDTAFMDAL